MAGQAKVKRQALEAAVRRAVLDQPQPPRPVRLAQLLRPSYGTTAGHWLAGLGVVLGLPLLVIELIAARDDPGHLLVAAFAALFSALFIGLPALLAMRAAGSVRSGIPVSAEVLEVEIRAPGDRTTLDAIRNGLARGRWRVAHPAGSFEASFETDAPWASSLHAGTRVNVLVQARKRAIAFVIGPEDGEG